jgi:hypothetical protein
VKSTSTLPLVGTNTCSQEKHSRTVLDSDKLLLSALTAQCRVGAFTKESTRLRQSRIRLLGRRCAIAQSARVHSPLIVLAAILMLAAGSTVAAAKPTPPPGVHIDPGSPAAKEYAIPLSEARGGGTTGNGQLFGRGITRASKPAPSTSAPSASGTDTAVAVAAPATPSTSAPRRVMRQPAAHVRTVPKHHHARPVVAAPAAQVSQPSRPVADGTGGGTGIVWMLGVAALVLALGGLGGAVIARHGRRTSARTS